VRLIFSSLEGCCLPILARASAGSLRRRSHFSPISAAWALVLEQGMDDIDDDDNAIAEAAASTRVSLTPPMMIP
jgi:hypothetical protein